MEASTSIVQLKYNKEQLCRRNPGICTSNACFLIDKSKLSHPDDILCDLHGKWELSKKKTIFYEYGEDLKLKKVEETVEEKCKEYVLNDPFIIMKQQRISTKFWFRWKIIQFPVYNTILMVKYTMLFQNHTVIRNHSSHM